MDLNVEGELLASQCRVGRRRLERGFLGQAEAAAGVAVGGQGLICRR
jgi:hypothetical protein